MLSRTSARKVASSFSSSYDVMVTISFSQLKGSLLTRFAQGELQIDVLAHVALPFDAALPIGYVARRAVSCADERAVLAHIVHGHFKVRPSSVFWWSAHTRFGTPAAPRDNAVHGVPGGVL